MRHDLLSFLCFLVVGSVSPRCTQMQPRSTPRHCTEAAEVPTFVSVHSTVGGLIDCGIYGGIPGGMTRRDFRKEAESDIDIGLTSTRFRLIPAIPTISDFISAKWRFNRP